jgi:Na+/proline symporter/signal transduction histidine kinase
MISIQSIALIALAYLVLLFLIAYLGDLKRFRSVSWLNPNVIYALSLAVYCSSWTFYGAVGTASVIGLDYIAIYLGPCLVFLFGYPVMRRIIIVCKENSITSISDFISSRYGKSRRIGVLVTIIAVVGSLPYIALQLKAVSLSFLVLSDQSSIAGELSGGFSSNDIAFYTGSIMALFAVFFGTRHLDATEHHAGVVLAISFESIVKLLAILVVGFYASYLLLDESMHGRFGAAVSTDTFKYNFAGGSSTWTSFITKTILSMGAIILLPRQFQMTVVEAHSHHQFRTAMWVMPIYLLLTTLIVVPIALAGSSLLPNEPADLYVLSLPLSAGNQGIGLLAFIGGLSAATGMVIVAVISLSTMICNDLVMPNLIRIKRLDILNRNNLDSIILLVRRLAIVGLVAVAYGYFQLMNLNAQLANIGLVSFAAVVQFLPSVLCAIFWRGAHSKGVYWGLIGGFLVWAYTLMLPTVLTPDTLVNLWFGWSWINPEALFGMRLNDSLSHGVFWSLSVNIFLLVVLSWRNEQTTLEKMQASRFYHTGVLGTSVSQIGADELTSIHPDSLRILTERIIGRKNTQSLFEQYQSKSGLDLSLETQVDRQLISLTQTAIASVIGSVSAQKVISDIIIGEEEYLDEVTTLVDETSSVLQFNRHLLQTTLQNITHGISVVDENLNLVIWNQRYIELFEYPENFIYVGKPISEVLEYNAQRGDFNDRDPALEIRKRLKHLYNKTPHQNTRTRPNQTVIKSIGEPMPNGGFVTTYEDITESVRASELLRTANEELENRVLERTQKLKKLSEELEKTTRSKTHFLAAASHDLLQPINAARLFAHSILERSFEAPEIANLAGNIDQSLVTANELLRALLDISKLDSGGIKPNFSVFGLHKFVADLVIELEGVAGDKNVDLIAEVPDIFVRSDKRLLLSVLQNLVSNAIRYTEEGGQVQIIVKRKKNDVEYASVRVLDTGIGIDPARVDLIFNEFYQIKVPGDESAAGLGLGLSIVDRISRLLDLKVKVTSVLGEGSMFTIDVPTSDQRVPLKSNIIDKNFIAPTEKLQGLNVMCIDNDLVVLNAMRTLLEGWGCQVTGVTTFKQGAEALQSGGYRIILADYRLDFEETGLDLLNLAQKLGEQDQKRIIKGVMITAEQDKSLEQLAVDSGFQYLPKPVEPAILKSVMLSLISEMENTLTF